MTDQTKFDKTRNRWSRRRLARRLASDQRAGAWAESRAIRMRYDFIRRGWFLVALWPLLACIVSPAVLLVPRSARDFSLGVIVASGFWGAAYTVGTASGAAPAAMGALSEQWTAGELRRLRHRGWRLLNQVRYRKWDIDHVLLGPGGVIVVETKFSADGWAPTRYTERVIADAVDRVKRNATDIQLSLGKSVLPDSLVHPLVVLWGRGDLQEVSYQRHGVQVLSGHLLRVWLAGIDDAGVDPATVDRLHQKLADHVLRRDQHDLDTAGSPPRTISSSIALIGLAAVLGLVSCFVELEILHVLGWYWVIPVGAALFALQLPFRRFHAARPWRVAWITGTQAVTVVTSLAYVGQALSHL